MCWFKKGLRIWLDTNFISNFDCGVDHNFCTEEINNFGSYKFLELEVWTKFKFFNHLQNAWFMDFLLDFKK